MFLKLIHVLTSADAPIFEPLFSSAGVQTVVNERAPAGIENSINLTHVSTDFIAVIHT